MDGKNFLPIYYQTLEEVMWLLRLDKPKKWRKLSKNFKICTKTAKNCDNKS